MYTTHNLFTHIIQNHAGTMVANQVQSSLLKHLHTTVDLNQQAMHMGWTRHCEASKTTASPAISYKPDLPYGLVSTTILSLIPWPPGSCSPAGLHGSTAVTHGTSTSSTNTDTIPCPVGLWEHTWAGADSISLCAGAREPSGYVYCSFGARKFAKQCKLKEPFLYHT